GVTFYCGGQTGGVALSGTGTFNLSAPTTGTYAGVLFFQARNNTRAFSVQIPTGTLSGTIYAKAALGTVLYGSSQLQAGLSVVADRFTGYSTASSSLAMDGAETVAAGVAGELESKDLSVFAGAGFSAAELDSIGEVVAGLSALLEPYNVTVRLTSSA